ncbi:hypothetical protein [Novispirillum itersonii]|uniref:Uncharacterized protein n=1 Tax=Novispirillum itersonii TaxID=189 RepID=A0A7W9ZJ77_NOVIT|nr:hypothetical protein [Novispirillum itersonii]MBB6212165.1 hypothetical protein [Novispirillum itersonii]
MSKKPTKPAGGAVQPKDENKAAINTALKGTVLPRLREWVPALTEIPDDRLYESAMEDPAVLYACLTAFAANRALFNDVTVGIGGAPVTDDDSALKCERSVNDIIGMVVRTGCRRFAKKVLDEKIPHQAVEADDQGLIDSLRLIIRDLWASDVRTKVGEKKRTPGEDFYEAIRDHLDHDWQVPLFPYYVELPPRLIGELGKGVTTLRTPEGIRELASIGRDSLDDAKRIVGNELAREMLDTNPKAARGVSQVGKGEFDRLNACFGDVLREKRWEVFNDLERLDALKDMDNQEIAALTPFLPVVGAETLKNIKKHFKHLYQVEAFLSIGIEVLGHKEFVATFGNPGRTPAIRKITGKMSMARLDGANPQAEFSGMLADVMRAYAANPEAYCRTT